MVITVFLAISGIFLGVLSGSMLTHLADCINPSVQGWCINWQGLWRRFVSDLQRHRYFYIGCFFFLALFLTLTAFALYQQSHEFDALANNMQQINNKLDRLITVLEAQNAKPTPTP
jgi:hypothetical protein